MQHTDEQVIAAIDSAPELVRETLSSADTAKTIAAIGSAHRLHLDQIGSLAQINRNLLIGLVDPSEMYGELVGIGVAPEEAKLIMSEINERIFVPLRETMRSGPKPAIFTAPTIQKVTLQPDATPPQTVHSTPLSAPVIQTPQSTQVFTAVGGWPGAPAGNWQPAAAVHVYVPGPTPPSAQPAASAPEHHVYTPAPTEIRPAPAQPNPVTSQHEPVVRTVRPVPQPPANLPGAPLEKPIDKLYVADPYREPM